MGVVSLYRRSLYLAGSADPWLAGTHEGAQTGMDDNGIHIGAMPPDQEGLLGGRSTRKSASDLPAPAPGADDG